MMMQLSEAAEIVGGELHGDDVAFDGVGTDTRYIHDGDLFAALEGKRDGHDFVWQAVACGAGAALVARKIESKPDAAPVPQIVVDDVTAALTALAEDWRGRFEVPMIAVTGSCGKTTVCRLLAAVLGARGNCLAPRASFNNQWGVPLTLLRLREAHTHAVIEMGMNAPGEIFALSEMAQPHIALINNVAPAHLAGFQAETERVSLQKIAAAKGEIFAGLQPDGIAVLNADDEFYDFWRRLLSHIGINRVVAFSVRNPPPPGVQVCARYITGRRFGLAVEGQRLSVRLRLFGMHNTANAVAAAAVAHAAGVRIHDIREGLEAVHAMDGRLRARDGKHGARVLDDSYNANPASTRAALDVLAGFDGVKIAVLGAMAELGSATEALHCEIGEYAHFREVDHFFCVGEATDTGIKGYLRGFGMRAEQFDDAEGLMIRLLPLLADAEAEGGANASTVLVKGSRAAGMERVVGKLAVTRREKAAGQAAAAGDDNAGNADDADQDEG